MISIERYPRLPGETDDSPRLLRAIHENPLRTILIPEGDYEIASPIIINNNASLHMEPMTRLICVKEMDFVIEWIGPEGKSGRPSRNCGITGGEIDGMGIASCMRLYHYVHFTMTNITFKNGKKYGLCVGPEYPGGVEVIANNLYFSNTMPGLQGNIGIYTNHTDGHYTDVVIVDYTIGVYDNCSGSNRYTRVHVWVGAMQVDGVAQYLKGSINYVLKAHGDDAGETVLTQCYADTGEIGFDIYTTTRLYGCAYYNNWDWLKFDNVLCIRNNTTHPVQVYDGCWTKTSPHAKFYEGTPGEQIDFRDNIFRGGLTY